MMEPARRSALLLLVVGALAGAAMIAAFQAYREPLQAWMLADPTQLHARARLLIAAAGSLLVVPLLAFAAYVWRMAGALDAPRGRGLKIMAAILVVCSVLLAASLWRLSVVLTR